MPPARGFPFATAAMTASSQARTWLLPLAMVTGGVGYTLLERAAFLTPYLIFTMLLVTCCRVSPRTIRFNRACSILLAIQVAGSAAAYMLLSPFSPLLAEGAMICVLAPTAMAAAVITGMLGGNVAFTAAYTLLASLAAAVIAPLFFAWTGAGQNVAFGQAAWEIFRRLAPLLLLPPLVAWLLERLAAPLHRAIRRLHFLTYYLWVAGLAIVSAKTVAFVVEQGSDRILQEIGLAIVALLACCAQFWIGRRVGTKHADTVSAGQALGQKNTVLAIWMAQLYLHPLASIAPAAYVLWQNSINSLQIWLHDKSSPPRA